MPITRAGWFPTARLYRPVHWRLFGLAGVLMSAGAGFAFGWELVRQDGGGRGTTSSARLPAPEWLPLVGVAFIAAGIAGLIAVHLSAPAANGERLPEHLRRPFDERAWPSALRIVIPFVAAMVLTSIASNRSADRWEPVLVATVIAGTATALS